MLCLQQENKELVKGVRGEVSGEDPWAPVIYLIESRAEFLGAMWRGGFKALDGCRIFCLEVEYDPSEI